MVERGAPRAQKLRRQAIAAKNRLSVARGKTVWIQVRRYAFTAFRLVAALAGFATLPVWGPNISFTIFYQELPEYIWIVVITHGSRRPGYWKKRLRQDDK
jgi:hypothetical protein